MENHKKICKKIKELAKKLSVSLSDDLIEIWALAYEGYTQNEIAEKLNVNQSTISRKKSLLFKKLQNRA